MCFAPRPPARLVLLALLAACGGFAQAPAPQTERLSFDAEWRLLRAGVAEMNSTGTRQIEMQLRTVGLVSKLIRIEDVYRATYGAGYCVQATTMDSQEGSRHRESKATFDSERKRAAYLDRDVKKNAVVRSTEIDTPACVHDVLGALTLVRQRHLEPGLSFTMPVSDGKKLINARVECQEKEIIKTKAGTFQTIRCEAFLLNGELYGRKGRLFVWISEDERRLPVQLRVQMPFYIGTVTLTLEKVEKQ